MVSVITTITFVHHDFAFMKETDRNFTLFRLQPFVRSSSRAPPSPLTAEFHLSMVQNIIRHCIERSSSHNITGA